MGAQENLAAIRSAYQNWNDSKGASADEILDLFCDEVVMHSALSPDVPAEMSGVHVSKAQARAYFEATVRDWDMLAYTVDRYIQSADGNEIVMVGHCTFRNKATGGLFDSPKIDISTFRDGKIVRFQESYDTLGFARALGTA